MKEINAVLVLLACGCAFIAGAVLGHRFGYMPRQDERIGTTRSESPAFYLPDSKNLIVPIALEVTPAGSIILHDKFGDILARYTAESGQIYEELQTLVLEPRYEELQHELEDEMAQDQDWGFK